MIYHDNTFPLYKYHEQLYYLASKYNKSLFRLIMKMSPKTATSLALILVSLTLTLASLTLTLASADTNAGDIPDFRNPSEVLRHFDLPGGLFPSNWASFRAEPLGLRGEKVYLTINYRNACNVTRPFCVDIPVHFCLETDRVECGKTISAIVYWRHLTGVKGVKVYKLFPGPIKTMQISQVKVSNLTPFGGPKMLQFISSEGDLSPWFPVAVIPSFPPSCDDANDNNQLLLPA